MNIFGLKNELSLEDLASRMDIYKDDLGVSDCYAQYHKYPTAHFDENTVQWYTDAFLSVRDGAKAIMEIGIDEFNPSSTTKYAAQSSTTIIKNLKEKNTYYFGLDIADKSYLNDSENNIHTIRCNSTEYEKVHSVLNSHNIDSLDFLFIDGDHSLFYAWKDWAYAEWVRVGGIVVLHDTHWHLGPKILYENIDEKYFDKKIFGNDLLNWGLAIARRIK